MCRSLLVMPLFHVHGLMAGLLAPLAAGASVILPAAGRFSAQTFWADAVKYQATFYTAVPTMHQACPCRACGTLCCMAASRLQGKESAKHQVIRPPSTPCCATSYAPGMPLQSVWDSFLHGASQLQQVARQRSCQASSDGQLAHLCLLCIQLLLVTAPHAATNILRRQL